MYAVIPLLQNSTAVQPHHPSPFSHQSLCLIKCVLKLTTSPGAAVQCGHTLVAARLLYRRVSHTSVRWCKLKFTL